MLKQLTYSKSGGYRSGSKNEPIGFFLNVLPASKEFQLLLGYFSSSAINILAVGFANFIFNGGKVKMVINHILSSNDKEALLKGQKYSEEYFAFNIRDYEQIKEALDEYGKHFFHCLAWLIASNRIEIKVVRPKSNKGISHYKSGVFKDGEEQVTFKASCNFTAYGLLENLEELDIKQSWVSDKEHAAILEYNDYFDVLFTGQADFVDYLSFKEIEEAIRTDFGGKEINELLIEEQKLLEEKRKKINDPNLKQLIAKLEKDTLTKINEPRFPYEKPRFYQVTAHENWVKNGHQGIFAMATGTGKTITALNCLLNTYKKNNSYKALILVPTIALLNQWKKECKKFNFGNIITVSSKEKWNNQLAFFNTANRVIDTSFIVIVTYASFVRPKFQSHLKQFPLDTLLIADEMHNMGATKIVASLKDVFLKNRIGLSATPHRQYDEIGNHQLESFFNDTRPYVFSYSMEAAMNNTPPALCKYTYYPHLVHLSDEELKQYIIKSKQLLKYLDHRTGRYKDCKEVEILLQERKRIIHKAIHKKEAFQKILRYEFTKKGNLKYTLVYVSEGHESDCSTIDEYVESRTEARIINEYTKMISEIDYSILVKQYTATTLDRETVIKDFESSKIHVLCSMRCLDEGVDMPRSELAIFCASTGNPRQFVQRRGRVLRLHKDKVHAVIHDLVVVPRITKKGTYYDMERNLIKKELARVVDFSALSMNPIDTYNELREVLEHYNLNLYDFSEEYLT